MNELKIFPNHLNKKQCACNFCTLKNPLFDMCTIDEALDELKQRLAKNASQNHLFYKRVMVYY
jgi:hypothetical protein